MVLAVILLAAVLCAVIDDAVWARQAARIRTALRLSDLSIEKAAIWMGEPGKPMDTSLLQRQLDGEGHLSCRRLARLPQIFQQWLALLTAQEEGLPPVVRNAAHLQVAVNGTKRHMAQMSDPLVIADNERRA